MSITAFNLFLGVMSLIALIVFIALYFVKAGYGIFRTASWGRHFQQAGVDTDGSPRISGHVLDVDALGTSF